MWRDTICLVFILLVSLVVTGWIWFVTINSNVAFLILATLICYVTLTLEKEED
jgi:hypothetical protein